MGVRDPQLAGGEARQPLRPHPEYHELGIEEFILSGYPHLEEAYQVGEGVMPVLRRRGLMAEVLGADGGPKFDLTPLEV